MNIPRASDAVVISQGTDRITIKRPITGQNQTKVRSVPSLFAEYFTASMIVSAETPST